MKHLKSTLLTLAALLCSTVASAYNFQVDGIFYDITNSSNLTVGVTYETSSYNSYSGDVVIPATVTYNDKVYTVTSIGSSAFRNCSSLTSIILPEGVTSIGSSAFEGCSSLTSIILPEGVTSIGSSAFEGCSSLTSIILPEGVTSIGSSTFSGCSSLTSIILPEGVTSIGNSAFYVCSSLTSITIPESVTSIGGYAFQYCSSLADIHIGSIESWLQINYFNDYSHPNCNGKDVKLYLDGELLTEVEIPATVTSIPFYAFRNCSSLTSITLPEGVTSIGGHAFSGCNGLKDLIIEDGEKDLVLAPISNTSSSGGYWYGAFYGLPLESLYLGRNIKNEGDRTLSHFGYCQKLESVEIGNTVTNIPSFTFYNSSSLTSITIPEGVTSIGSSAFYGCSSLALITVPESVTSIGSSAFYGCGSLADIHIGSIESWLKINYSNNTSHPNYYGKDVKLYLDGELLTEVEIPATVTSIPSYAFHNCSSLTSINLPEGVISIGSYAFDGCSSLKNFTLNSTTPPTLASNDFLSFVVLIVPEAAYNDYLAATYWKDLASQITIDDADARVKNLTLTAEADKSALQIAIGEEEVKYVTDLTISGSINSYDFMILRNKMPVLRRLNLENASIVANDYEHYTGCNTVDNKFPSYGLYNCKLLSLVFPKNITSIGSYSIKDNIYLSDVTIFEGVTVINGYAFYNCDALTTITIPEGITSIGNYAFQSCNNLNSITLPKSLSTVGSYAFENCQRLTSITFHDGLTSIGQYAFRYCYALEEVVLPPTVKTISTYAFYGCSKLKEIRIPSSIRSVGDYAFQYCDNLNDVYVYTVEPINIGQNTFAMNGNNFTGTLHAPKVSYWDYYYDTQWSQFTSFVEFDEPYENFYLVGDKQLDNTTGAIEGEGDKNPDAEMGSNSGIIVEDDVTQDLGNVDIEHNGSDGGSIIVGGEGCVNADELHFHINVTGGRWYFFCFPFDVRREDIVLQNGAEWVFRYYDGEERAKNGKGGWKNVTSDGNGNHLKAATGYIFQCSKNDVLILTAKNQKIKQEKKYNELVEHVTQNNMHDASWNFVGNPYLSYYEITSDDYSAPITVWDGSKYIAIRPGDDDYQLAPFEGFFVQKPEGTANIEYNPGQQMTYHQAQKAAEQARARRRAMPVNPDRLLVNITLSNGADTDQSRVVFNNEAAMGYETACDAAKFETAGVPQIYTVDSRAVKYAINERPVAEGIVTLGYTAPTEGVYTLAAPRMDTPIYIKDNLTGTIHDFAEGSYEFASEAGTFDDRFTVIMKAGETGIDNAEIGNQNSEIYNVKGQRVNEATEQGIYIKENRKVVIK